MRRYLAVVGFTLTLIWVAWTQTKNDTRPALVLEGKAASLRVDLAGGSISDFHLTDLPLNPLTWDSGSGADPRPMGHFLCLDRWGAPSKAEQRNGMPFHGEASHVMWRVVSPPNAGDANVESEIAATLPLAGFDIVRKIRLSQKAAFFSITEQVKNARPLGRIYNMVQHPTIGPPFLDEGTLVDSNGRRGFMQSSPMPNPEQPEVQWPHASNNGSQVDMRRLTSDPTPNVVSYIIDEEYGWTTASSISRGLLIGYIWKTADYPWFNAWRNTDNGKPTARGLEFGTTGLHQPFPTLVKKGRIFDRPLYFYLDAGETAARSYAAFLAKIPADYRGVAKLTYANGRLQLFEQGGKAERTISIDVGALFPE